LEKLLARARIFPLCKALEAFHMPRRRQLKGISGNLAQWCLSRNFDLNGYWAVGQLYAFAKSKKDSEIDLAIVRDFVVCDLARFEYSEMVLSIYKQYSKDSKCLNIPITWIKDVTLNFKFESEYQHKYHYFGSALGGEPAMWTVSITADNGRVYKSEAGCNVWIHNPKREYRRSGF